MNKDKIMEKVREYVDTIPFEVGDFGIAQHPIFSTFGTIDLDEKDETKRLVKIDDSNFERLKEQRYKIMEKSLDKKDGLFGMFLMINKPYRIPILMRIDEELTTEQFSDMLIDQWTTTEFPHENGAELMILLFMKAEKKYLMTKNEKAVYDALPNNVLVYRGLQKNAIKKGLSWTLSKKIAVFFATRFDRKGGVLSANVPKEYIFAYKNEREEEEIILNPNYLKNIKEVQYGD